VTASPTPGAGAVKPYRRTFDEILLPYGGFNVALGYG
jgi:hypothetical protein